MAFAPRPRCAKSLLISVVSTEGRESGVGRDLVFGGTEFGVVRIEDDLVPGVVHSVEFSLGTDLSLDLPRSRFMDGVLVTIFLGVTVRAFDLGVAHVEVELLFVGEGFVRDGFCGSTLLAFFFVEFDARDVRFVLIRFIRADMLPVTDELSLPPSLVPSPPAFSLMSSGKIAHGSS